MASDLFKRLVHLITTDPLQLVPCYKTLFAHKQPLAATTLVAVQPQRARVPSDEARQVALEIDNQRSGRAYRCYTNAYDSLDDEADEITRPSSPVNDTLLSDADDNAIIIGQDVPVYHVTHHPRLFTSPTAPTTITLIKYYNTKGYCTWKYELINDKSN